MSFSCADNERYNEALIATYAGELFEDNTAQEFASQGFPYPFRKPHPRLDRFVS